MQQLSIEQELANSLIERLHCLKIKVKNILCIGELRYSPDLELPEFLAQAQCKYLSAESFVNQLEAEPTKHYDLIISNCAIVADDNFENILAKLANLLAADGLLFLSCFGPTTLQDLLADSASLDLIALGNLLLKHNFNLPVVDVDFIQREYHSINQLLQELAASSFFDIEEHTADEAFASIYTANFEVIYLQAFKPKALAGSNSEGLVHIKVADIPILD